MYFSLHRFILSFVLVTSLSLQVLSQNVRGTVFNEKGDLLPYASVSLKGTSKGTAANDKGNFSFNLKPGRYVLVCRYIGCETQERSLEVNGDTIITFVLKFQKLTLDEVVVRTDREDPAYEIIRQSIAKRVFYRRQVKGYNSDLYSKDKIILKKLPSKIFGQTIDSDNKKEMGVDSAGKGILYLSESLSRLHILEPDKFKMEVKSSRVSGSNSFGFTFPVLISLYDNNVNIFDGMMNARGFVSPIADGALGFYKYKFLGTFWEDGKAVNAIRVTPRRKFEPLFTGVINITEDDWRIHSFDLFLTRQSQLQLLDTLHISQMFVPVNTEVWMLKNQLLSFSFNILGIAAQGRFLNVFSDYEIDPVFEKKYFDRVVIKYDTAVTSRQKTYWDTVRPVPLEPEEISDYRVKDSIMEVTKREETNIDSLKKKQGTLKPFQVVGKGIQRTHYGKKSNFQWGIDPLLSNSHFNNAEGFNMTYSGYVSLPLSGKKMNMTLYPLVRYGFGNGHLNPSLIVEWRKRKLDAENNLQRSLISIAGGKRVSQYSKDAPIGEWLNTVSTLRDGNNYMKTYENDFVGLGYRNRQESGWLLVFQALWENRRPLANTNNFTMRKSDSIRIKPNYPEEIVSAPVPPHQAFIIQARISIKPGQRYIQFPHSKLPLGSQFPTFELEYTKGVRGFFGSDVDFDRFLLSVKDTRNFKLAGSLGYKVGIGGFLSAKQVYAQDYQHFNGNRVIAASEYLNSFQTAGYYANSTKEPLYAFGHLEHHLNGLLTNKIPFMKKWKWNLVAGCNGFFVSRERHYADAFVGIENIFKFIRVDYVVSYVDGRYYTPEFRIGLGGIFSGGGTSASPVKPGRLRTPAFTF